MKRVCQAFATAGKLGIGHRPTIPASVRRRSTMGRCCQFPQPVGDHRPDTWSVFDSGSAQLTAHYVHRLARRRQGSRFPSGNLPPQTSRPSANPGGRASRDAFCGIHRGAGDHGTKRRPGYRNTAVSPARSTPESLRRLLRQADGHRGVALRNHVRRFAGSPSAPRHRPRPPRKRPPGDTRPPRAFVSPVTPECVGLSVSPVL